MTITAETNKGPLTIYNDRLGIEFTHPTSSNPKDKIRVELSDFIGLGRVTVMEFLEERVSRQKPRCEQFYLADDSYSNIVTAEMHGVPQLGNIIFEDGIPENIGAGKFSAIIFPPDIMGVQKQNET